MNDLSDLISPEAIDAALSVTNKKTLFQQLASAGGRLTGLPAKEILAALQQREKLGSTGFGNGVAIPHGKVEGLNGIFGCFARLNTAVDYQAIDNLPVDLVFLLLSPPDTGANHLKALARVSRALRDRATMAKLRGARSRDAIFALLSGVETLNAA
jgi:PTS system nitrogen regulatory IIA component